MTGRVAKHCAIYLLNRALFPFYGRWRFAGDVVHHPIHSGHLVDDAVRDASEDVVGEACPICGHSVLAGHSAHGYQVTISAVVSHNTDAPEIGKDGESLP